MAKVKCRSCDICGEMNAKDGFMLKAKRVESHNERGAGRNPRGSGSSWTVWNSAWIPARWRTKPHS